MVMPVGKEGDILLLLFGLLFGIPALIYAVIHVWLGLQEIIGVLLALITFFILAFYFVKYYLQRKPED